MRFIDRFDVILLDMMQTFMFDGDRFSDRENYAETYRSLGGHKLSPAQVRSVISETFERMLKDYNDPARYACFPTAGSYLETVLHEQNLPASEVELLDTLFAKHETGRIPEAHARTLHQLDETHRLGLVSNIWCRSDLCRKELSRAGVADLFEVVLLSSDHGIIKPSPLIFEKAVASVGLDKSKILFVGDDLKYDVAGAKGAGLAVVWIDTKESEIDETMPQPDLVIEELRDLLELA